MTPEQIRLAVKAVAIALTLAAVAAAGWMVNGWRLGTQLEHTQRERDGYVDQVKVLGQGVQACNAGVELARKHGAVATDLGRKLLEEAKRLHAGWDAQVARTEALLEKPTPAGAGCNEAWAEIEKEPR